MHDADAERKLWGEVLNRAIIDALWVNLNDYDNDSHSGVSRKQQREAIRWIRGGRHFQERCGLAGFDPEFVQAHVLPLVDAPPAARLAFLSGIGSNGNHRAPVRPKRR